MERCFDIHLWISFTPNATVLFVDVAIQPEVNFIAKQNSLMKIGNNGNLVLGPFDESVQALEHVERQATHRAAETPKQSQARRRHTYGEKYGVTKALTGSVYLDALQLWQFSQLEQSEQNNFIWQQNGAPLRWHPSERDWSNITVPNQWIGRKEPPDKACIA
ncbi:fatty acid hydroxylase domain-containing protein 2 [Trichonephila clavipes]|nr:fatty acid hydroxylase domain-containing protein 2 [Trichonephila clavipes]